MKTLFKLFKYTLNGFHRIKYLLSCGINII